MTEQDILDAVKEAENNTPPGITMPELELARPKIDDSSKFSKPDWGLPKKLHKKGLIHTDGMRNSAWVLRLGPGSWHSEAKSALEAAKRFIENVIKTDGRHFDYDEATQFVSKATGKEVVREVVVRSLNQLIQRKFFEKRDVEGTNKYQVTSFQEKALAKGALHLAKDEQDKLLGVRDGVTRKQIIASILQKLRSQASYKVFVETADRSCLTAKDFNIRDFFAVFSVSSQTPQDGYEKAKQKVLLATEQGSTEDRDYVAALDRLFGSDYRDYFNKLLGS